MQLKIIMGHVDAPRTGAHLIDKQRRGVRGVELAFRGYYLTIKLLS